MRLCPEIAFISITALCLSLVPLREVMAHKPPGSA
jgi:hypothetical protein